MSTTFTVFTQSPVPPIEVCRFVQSALPGWAEDAALESDGRPYLSGDFMGLDVHVFSADGFVDDLGIAFSTFSLGVGVKRWAGEANPEVVADFARSLATLIGSRWHLQLGVDNVVVREMQSVVATFAGRSDYGLAPC